MNRQAFIAKVVSEAMQAGVSVKLLNKRTVKRTGGWFNGKELVVAYNNVQGFEILLHEYCHMQQCIDSCKEWNDYVEDASIAFTHWLNGKGDDASEAKSSMHKCIALELDCEVRALQCIKDYKLDIDAARYAKLANIYLYSHHRMLQHRKWFTNLYHDDNFNAVPDALLHVQHYIDDTDADGNKVSEQLHIS
jgi:hypothetical protein